MISKTHVLTDRQVHNHNYKKKKILTHISLALFMLDKGK